MTRRAKRRSAFKAGMYLLENLTSGMYTDPLTILREYIQNGVDSIDLIPEKKSAGLLEVQIELDPKEKRVFIRDNGQGIPASVAEKILSSIGISNKTDPNQRGFRGIGRLGGIAFSDRAVFRTKATSEKVESVQEWDCQALRELIVKYKEKSLTFSQLFSRITSFSQVNSKKGKESYFEVTLHGVSSFRNYIFDITRVKRYLSQVAPVPFHPTEFSYGTMIDQYLEEKLNHYRRYNVILNGEQIFKPYRDSVRITKGGFDRIKDIMFFELKNPEDRMIACGWYGERQELLGSIIRGDNSSGIRVRAGNIMLGDKHLLDGCFRETRFNSYVPGEIHAEYEGLMPNSRRDDFVDNKDKGFFYNDIERKIGLPISKEIRLRSRQRSEMVRKSVLQDKSRDSQNILCESTREMDAASENNLENSNQIDQATEHCISSAELLKEGNSSCDYTRTFTETLTECCKGCDRLPRLLTLLATKSKYTLK